LGLLPQPGSSLTINVTSHFFADKHRQKISLFAQKMRIDR
jgi:hypothetical protein